MSSIWFRDFSLMQIFKFFCGLVFLPIVSRVKYFLSLNASTQVFSSSARVLDL